MRRWSSASSPSASGLGTAIALASMVYVAAGLLLLTGILFFVTRDSQRMQAELGRDTRGAGPRAEREGTT